MRLLPLRVSVGQLWTRLSQAEPQLPEQALALADSQVDGERLLHPGRQRFAVPKVAAQPDLPWRLPQGLVDRRQLRRRRPPRPPPGPFRQPGEAARFEVSDPIFDDAARIAQQLRDLRARHALRHQQHPVQSVVIPRFLGPSDFVLQAHDDRGRVGDRERFHGPMKP